MEVASICPPRPYGRSALSERGRRRAGPQPGRRGGDGASEERILDALKQVYDPELGINIVDLGLVYEVQLAADRDVDIRYSLTTMGCPIGPLIEDQMRAFLAPIEWIGEVRPSWCHPAVVTGADVRRGQGGAGHLSASGRERRIRPVR